MFRKFSRYLNRRFNRFYHRSRVYMIIDIILIAVVIILSALLLRLYSYQPEISLSPWSKPVPRQEIDLNNPPLDLSYKVENNNIYWNNGANLTIRLKNNGKYLIEDVNLSLVSQSQSYTLSRLEFSSFQKTSLSGMEIKGYNVYLNELAPGTDREVNLLIHFKKESSGNRVISGRLDSEYKVVGQTIKESLLLSDLKVASELYTTAAAYYNSSQGDQLGSGPFPPISQVPTNLWVSFQTQAPADFKNFVMSARLANNVEFTDNASLLAGNINYNPDTRQIIWQVEELNNTDDDYRAGFEIELTPTTNQVGTYAKLLTNIKYQAIDYFTGLPVSGTLTDIDTSLKKDSINKNEGIILSIDSL